MTWAAQVRHVLMRDLRNLRWGLAGVAVLLGLAMLRAVDVVAALPGTVVLGPTVRLGVVFLMAAAILADPARRADAYWATTPLRGSAVGAAKMALLLLVTVVLVCASHGVRLAWGLPPDALPVGGAGVAARTMATLLPLLLVAAASRDLRGFTLALVLLIGLTIAASILAPTLPTLPRPWADTGVPVLVVVLGIGALLVRYARPGDDARMQGVIIAVALLTSGFVVAASRRSGLPPTTMADLADVRLAVVDDAQPVCKDGYLLVPIEAVAPAGRRLDLLAPSLTITTVTGARVVTRQPEWGQVMGTWGALLPLRESGASWRVVGSAAAPRRTTIAFPLSADERTTVCGRIARVTLAIDVRVAEARRLVEVPVRAGARATAPGGRATIRRVAGTTESLQLVVQVDRMSREHDVDPPLDGATYALIDPSTGDAYPSGDLTTMPGANGFAVLDVPGFVHASTGELLIDFPLARSGSVRAPVASPSRLMLLVATPRDRLPLRVQREAVFHSTTPR